MNKPKLVILNGLPASGKSTLAKIYANNHPMTLRLDIDDIRSSISHWEEHLTESSLQARAMAVGMARIHLQKGHDVVVPQAYGVLRFLEEWETLAQDCNASYFEIMLTLDKDEAIRRFIARGDYKGLQHTAIPSNIEEFSNKISHVAKTRPQKILDQASKDLHESYAVLLSIIETDN